jgi:PAS domain S-box-containing protein
MLAAIIGTTILATLLDFWTSAELIGSILFTFPLALCAMQRSKRLLWGTSTAVVLLTIAGEFWGFNRVELANPWVPSVNRVLLIASLLTLTALIHLLINQRQKIELDAAKITYQRSSLLAQNEQLENALTAATREIAVRKAAEEHAIQTEARYRALLEAAPDAMVIVGPDGIIELANVQTETLFGYTRQELIGQSVDMLVPKTFRAVHSAPRQGYFKMAKAREVGKGSVLYGLRKDGTEFPIEISLSPLETATGTLALAAIRDGTERRKAEARYRGLLEAAPDAMVVVNQAGDIVLLNLQAEKQFGYYRDELLGQQVTNIIPKGFAERLITDGTRSAADALAQQIGTGIELSARRKDGSEFPIEIMLSPLENADGILVTAAIRDISVRRAAEEHLAQMEERYRGLLEAAPDAMVVVNQAGEIVILNIQAEQQFGYYRDELLGQQVTNIIPKGFAERLITDGTRTAADALTQQLGTGIELSARRKDGSEFPIEIMLSPLQNADGILVTAAIRDISIRKVAEEALRQSEERLRLVVSSVTDYAILMLDLDGRVVSWNEGAERIKGYRAEEIIGQNFSCFYLPEDISDGKPALQLAEATRNGRSEAEGWRVRKDGSRFYADVVVTALYDETGLLRGFGKITRDITERKRTEGDLVKTAEDLKRSNDQLQQFAYVASHDLQEPLRMVASYTQLLAKRYQGRLDSDADEFIAYAVDGCSRMQGLIRDLLAYSRSGTEGKMISQISGETALKEALANLQVSIEESGATVTHDLLPDLATDDTQLVQVLQNLIGNAIKYRGVDVPLVHVSAKKSGGKEWIFSVRDNGLGIAPQYFERIFIIFQRLHGRQEFNGTGIGLAICKKVVERLGGRIWVESQIDKGSTFYFSLPESIGK